MALDAVDVLLEARAYIEKGWCQGEFARGETGIAVDGKGFDGAVSWCARGAVLQAFALGATSYPPPPAVLGAYLLLADAVDPDRDRPENYGVVEMWNDHADRTQDEVLEAFDKAILLGLERTGER